MMNQQQEIMVFAIGAGVGVAAVIGTLKVCGLEPGSVYV
jgi:hypothetical protein